MPASTPHDERVVRSPKLVAVWAQRPRHIPDASRKSAEWLTQGDAAALLGVSNQTANFRKAWRALVAAAVAGEPATFKGVTVRMKPCSIKGVDRWCAHREDLVHLAADTQRQERRWPTRPEGLLTLEEAAERAKADMLIDPDVFADAWRALTKGTAFEGFARIAGLDIQLTRGHLYATERWFIHPDDVARLADALRGRLPHLRKGFVTPDDAAAGVQPDARRLARALYGSLTQSKTLTGEATLDGEPVEMRRFLVNGKPMFCLPESEMPRFYHAVTGHYDATLLAGLDHSPASMR